MPESVEIKILRAVITLAEEMSYARAAERLNIAPAELKKQIFSLEEQLCFYVFRPKHAPVELTEEGRVFLHACLEFVGLSDHSS